MADTMGFLFTLTLQRLTQARTGRSCQRLQSLPDPGRITPREPFLAWSGAIRAVEQHVGPAGRCGVPSSGSGLGSSYMAVLALGLHPTPTRSPMETYINKSTKTCKQACKYAHPCMYAFADNWSQAPTYACIGALHACMLLAERGLVQGLTSTLSSPEHLTSTLMTAFVTEPW